MRVLFFPRLILPLVVRAMLASALAAGVELSLGLGLAGAETITLLANGDTSGWEYKSLDEIPETRYWTGPDEELGENVLFAASEKGASGWLLERDDLDFAKTPWVHFQWRVDAAGGGFDETRKSGDDYALRIYFAARSGIQFRTIVLARTQQAAGEFWESPYGNWLSDIFIHSVAGADSPAGEWQIGRVNMAELWRARFGADAAMKAGAAGLMTDGDSAGVEMRARYGRILLSDSADSPFSAPPP